MSVQIYTVLLEGAGKQLSHGLLLNDPLFLEDQVESASPVLGPICLIYLVQAWEPAAGEVMTNSYAVCMNAAQQTAAGMRIGAMGIEVVFHAFCIHCAPGRC